MLTSQVSCREHYRLENPCTVRGNVAVAGEACHSLGNRLHRTVHDYVHLDMSLSLMGPGEYSRFTVDLTNTRLQDTV